jgi:DNA-binding beta-propeller fold protein YncE
MAVGFLAVLLAGRVVALLMVFGGGAVRLGGFFVVFGCFVVSGLWHDIPLVLLVPMTTLAPIIMTPAMNGAGDAGLPVHPAMRRQTACAGARCAMQHELAGQHEKLEAAGAAMTDYEAFMFQTVILRFLPCLALTALLALAAAPARAAGVAIVVNSGEASLSLVDMATMTELRRIPVLREPHHLMLTPDHKELLVGDASGNEMLFLDPSTGAIRHRMPMADPYQFGFSPDGKWLVVNGLARAQVDVYNAATMQLEKRYKLSSMPSHVSFSPDSGVSYVSLQGTGRLVAIDLKHEAVLWDEPVGESPAGVLWHNGRVLVAIMGSDNVAVVNPADGHVERRIRTGKGAHQIFPSPDGKVLYVNNRVDGTSTVLDGATLQLLRNIKIPGGPDCIDFAPDGKLWVTERWAKRVAVVDPQTGAIQSIDVGRSPHGIFLTTDLH